MTAIRPIIAVGLALLSLYGCGGPDLSGTWVGERKVETRPDADAQVAEQLRIVKLIVKPNGVAYLSLSGVPLEGMLLGNSKGGTFRTDSIAGVRMERQSPEMREQYPEMNLTLKGEELTLEVPNSKEHIVLKREPQPRTP